MYLRFSTTRTIFDEAGITAVPTTWAELDAACAKIKEKGYTPITCDDAYITCMFGYHMSRLVGEPKTEEIVKGGQWDDPSVTATAEAYADLPARAISLRPLPPMSGRQDRTRNWPWEPLPCT